MVIHITGGSAATREQVKALAESISHSLATLSMFAIRLIMNVIIIIANSPYLA